MYYMIHAADHPEAYKLMARAYRATVSPSSPFDQPGLFPEPKNPASGRTRRHRYGRTNWLRLIVTGDHGRNRTFNLLIKSRSNSERYFPAFAYTNQ
jgi:hypothetical protein